MTRLSLLARRLGRRITSLRVERGLTQEKLAWEAGFSSKGYLSRIESGQRLPSVETLDRVARRLNVEVRDLFINPERSRLDEAMELLRKAKPEARERARAALEGRGKKRRPK